MTWNINYAMSVKKDIQKFDVSTRKRLKKFIEDRLAKMENPRTIGGVLTGSKLGQFWKFRVGDYRIISEIQDKILTILIIEIGHRKEIYR